MSEEPVPGKDPAALEEAEPFYQTRNVRVLWIPPRKSEYHWQQRPVALAVASGLVVVAVLIPLSGVLGTASSTPAADSVQVAAAGNAVESFHMSVPVPVAPRMPVPVSAPAPSQPVPRQPRTRAELTTQIARCKEASANCTVEEVLQMGRELIDQRRARPADTRGH
jgi:hypothetical protein